VASGRFPLVIIGEHATESFPATNGALRKPDDRRRPDQPIVEALVIPLGVITHRVFFEGTA
jgi:hypothetical protein